jgi:hypothetical protein
MKPSIETSIKAIWKQIGFAEKMYSKLLAIN